MQEPKGHPSNTLPPNPPTVHTRPPLDHSHPPNKPQLMRTEHPHPHAPVEPLHPAAFEDKNKYYNSNFGPRHDFNDGPFRGRPPAPPLLSDQNQFMSRPSKLPFPCFVGSRLSHVQCMKKLCYTERTHTLTHRHTVNSFVFCLWSIYRELVYKAFVNYPPTIVDSANWI